MKSNQYFDSNITIRGNYKQIFGNYCKVYGDHCHVYGNYNEVIGKGTQIFGNYNRVKSDNASVFGSFNRVQGLNVTDSGCQNRITNQSVDNDATGGIIPEPTPDEYLETSRYRFNTTDNTIMVPDQRDLEHDCESHSNDQLCKYCQRNVANCLSCPCVCVVCCVECARARGEGMLIGELMCPNCDGIIERFYRIIEIEQT